MEVDRLLERVKLLSESLLYDSLISPNPRKGHKRVYITRQHFLTLIEMGHEFLDEIELRLYLLEDKNIPDHVRNPKRQVAHRKLVEAIDLFSGVLKILKSLEVVDVNRPISECFTEEIQREAEEEE